MAGGRWSRAGDAVRRGHERRDGAIDHRHDRHALRSAGADVDGGLAAIDQARSLLRRRQRLRLRQRHPRPAGRLRHPDAGQDHLDRVLRQPRLAGRLGGGDRAAGELLLAGQAARAGGRAGDPASIALAYRLRELPFRIDRLKTGTPPRIDGRTIDFSKLEEQHGDTPVPVFSFMGKREQHPKQIPCHITRTNNKTHDIIRAGLDRSPLYSGIIEGIGPRYCPSIEDKIVRFADRDTHQIFVEPEGLDTHEIYPNGISTSLPFDVQYEFVRSMLGFENAEIIRPGYAIEYDFFDPRDLKMSLETKHMDGLFFAGQINGTTGYEEAAAQGLLAGTNAALMTQDKESWCPKRDEAYLGVLVDDLITRGVSEPYRMFTSRAEYRLMLREDNADLRLTEIGRNLGLVDDDRWTMFNQKQETIQSEEARLKKFFVRPQDISIEKQQAIIGKAIDHEYNLFDLLRRPEVSFEGVKELMQEDASLIDPAVREQVEISAKYKGYIVRQQEEVDRSRDQLDIPLPIDLDYKEVHGLSVEAQQKLNLHKPENLGQASRISGITPATISLLLVFIKRKNKPKKMAAKRPEKAA